MEREERDRNGADVQDQQQAEDQDQQQQAEIEEEEDIDPMDREMSESDESDFDHEAEVNGPIGTNAIRGTGAGILNVAEAVDSLIRAVECIGRVWPEFKPHLKPMRDDMIKAYNTLWDVARQVAR